MVTEKDIRKFMADNRPSVSGSDEFMEDIVRQIELLPVPSSLTGKEDETICECIASLRRTAGFLKKRYLIQAVIIVSVAILLTAAAVLAFSVVPEISGADAYVMAFLSVWKYIAAGCICICVLTFSIRHTDLYHI